jgi:hypothetical protein
MNAHIRHGLSLDASQEEHEGNLIEVQGVSRSSELLSPSPTPWTPLQAGDFQGYKITKPRTRNTILDRQVGLFPSKNVLQTGDIGGVQEVMGIDEYFRRRT